LKNIIMKQITEISENERQAIRSVDVSRFLPNTAAKRLADKVVIEQPVTIMIDKVGSFTVMATPSDIEALAVGFIFSEGLIDFIDDIVEISAKPELPNVVGIRVHDPTRLQVRRNMIVASSCGLCGTRNIEKMLSEMPACENTLIIESGILIEVTGHMKSMQKIFQVTGGTHAAGIFDSSGKIFAFAEDLGRHCALDKAIGKCLLNRLSTKGCAVALSGRVSLEMVTKAARAGIELIAAVSAPTSLAIEAAERWNITLCGFVRSDKLNVYTIPERIKIFWKGA
jgi:FdhD protein